MKSNSKRTYQSLQEFFFIPWSLANFQESHAFDFAVTIYFVYMF